MKKIKKAIACYVGTKVKDKLITTEQEILPSCGSKYMLSILSDAFNLIKKDLNDIGNTRTERQEDNPYMKGSIANLYLRPSCNEFYLEV